jgi:hypothetical protein
MRVLRVIPAILAGGWGLVNLFPLFATIGLKLDWLSVPPGGPESLHLLAKQIPWWGLTIWALMIVLYLLVAQALLRDRPAFRLYAAAFGAELVRWVPMYLLPAYVQTFAAYMQFRYIAWAVLVVLGAITWWVDRTRSLPTQAQRA